MKLQRRQVGLFAAIKAIMLAAALPGDTDTVFNFVHRWEPNKTFIISYEGLWFPM